MPGAVVLSLLASVLSGCSSDPFQRIPCQGQVRPRVGRYPYLGRHPSVFNLQAEQHIAAHRQDRHCAVACIQVSKPYDHAAGIARERFVYTGWSGSSWKVQCCTQTHVVNYDHMDIYIRHSVRMCEHLVLPEGEQHRTLHALTHGSDERRMLVVVPARCARTCSHHAALHKA